MKPNRDWKALVAGHARITGADLPPHTIDELAAHLGQHQMAGIALDFFV